MTRRTAPLALALVALAATARAGEPSTAPRRVIRPCSVGKICQELTRRFHTPVAATPDLLETRVTWSFNRETSLDSALSRLAELTDSLIGSTGTGDKRRITLERTRIAPQVEAAWRRQSLARTIDAIVQAPPDKPIPGLSTANQRTLKRTPILREYLRFLTPEMLNRVLAGDRVQLPAGRVSEDEIRKTAHSVWGAIAHGPDDHEVGSVDKRVEATVDSVRKHGIFYNLRTDNMGPPVLTLELGREVTTALCHFNDEELGLPNTHTNPYRLLQNNLKVPVKPVLSPALQAPLAADVPLPKDRLWHSILGELTAAAHLDVVSDGYLARRRSRMLDSRYLPADPAPAGVLFKRGTRIADALDSLCERYHYLWWEKNGTVYLRASAWIWDREIEPPDQFVDAWSAALERKSIGKPQLESMASLNRRQFGGLHSLGNNSFAWADYSASMRDFLTLYQASSPARQAALLAGGIPLTQRECDAMGIKNLLLQITSGAPEGTAVIRLAFNTKPDPQNPGCDRVTLSIVRKWPNKTQPIDFWFDFPVPGEAFA